MKEKHPTVRLEDKALGWPNGSLQHIGLGPTYSTFEGCPTRQSHQLLSQSSCQIPSSSAHLNVRYIIAHIHYLICSSFRQCLCLLTVTIFVPMSAGFSSVGTLDISKILMTKVSLI
ncbi:hypothetical protein Dimus_039676 [Dionaea muscipula]